MKSIILNFKFFAFGLIIFSISACSGPQESGTDTTAEQATDEVGGVKKVGSVVDGYLKLKDALVASDAEEAKEYAVATLGVVDAIAMPEVQQSVKEIAATTDIEEQRKVFEHFTIHLYRDLKASDANKQILYKQYCPMAFDNQGAYWLSAQEEIRNPYFGDRMLKCGRVEEELPVNN
ncbi:hypothetical protein OKW21_000894 [Catalinimonas alkaloidigena]|uniref:DUF3347 domain-containing protein n=1 Tax=Catalinimonas alkaloidigena TaxID=1075417 RepID=UPI0024061FA9|nr:DUF3347 domain-containing protein [Catalinimonas alkaloidigena]MDF9795631.1 hypothetical protein [Catalinimonas alkaloidigena]